MAWFEAADGERLWYQVEGRRDRPAVLLLHGFAQTAASFDIVAPRLAASWRVVRVDLYGHGRSSIPPNPARLGWEPTGRDLVALMADVGAERFAVLGYSMGGRLALDLALRHPGRLWALVLESASPGLADPEERAQRRASDDALADAVESRGIEWFAAYWASLPLFRSHERMDAHTRAALQAMRTSQRARGLAQSLRGAGTGVQPNWWPDLAALTVPTLLVVGAEDAKYLDINRKMAAAIPAARLEVVPQSGHTPHLEQPEAFFALVAAHLEAALPSA
jgi:2-succinyl-6-hydroxy-2,4-cyclohexadiene-1-carboxylate synthase